MIVLVIILRTAEVTQSYLDGIMTTTGAKNEAIMEDRRVRECIGMTFPFKLYGMLEDVEKEGDTCMVSWRHHGNAFTVHEPHVFVEKIMPYYFNQSKYKSFQRQLNLYGFVCIPRGEDKGKTAACSARLRRIIDTTMLTNRFYYCYQVPTSTRTLFEESVISATLSSAERIRN